MNVPLRIAMFTGRFPVVSETFILRQITGLLDLGHAVEIYADTRAEAAGPVQPGVIQRRLLDRTVFMDLPPETVPAEMPVWPLMGETWPPGAEQPVPNLVRVDRALPAFLRALMASPGLAVQTLRRSEYGYQADSLSALHRLARCGEQGRRYDVLHAHFGPVGNSFRFARALWRAPMLVSFHGYDLTTLPRREGTGMYAKLFATADLVTVNSEFSRGRVAQLGCPPDKLRLLPVGMDPAEFAFRERTLKRGEPLRVVSVGRLVEIKGHEFVIRALALLRKTRPAVRLDIVGDGPLREELQQLIRALGLEQWVTLHGALAADGVRGLLGQAHVFVLASVNVEGDQEGQGLALQEAQACGLPVIATDHGAFPEGIRAGESGFLVPERDPGALAERLEFLAVHADRWAAMGRAGRKFVEARYEIHKLNARLVELYGEAREHYRADH
jgi:colanic acid/amylovoran biosynthesis glycosyltransferase